MMIICVKVAVFVCGDCMCDGGCLCIGVFVGVCGDGWWYGLCV